MVDHKSVLLFSRAVPAAFLLVSTSHNGQNLCYLIELVTRLNSYSCRAFFKKYGTIHYTGHSRHSQSVYKYSDHIFRPYIYIYKYIYIYISIYIKG